MAVTLQPLPGVGCLTRWQQGGRVAVWGKPAESPPARAGWDFFADPADPTQRRYEALRCYLYDGASAAQVADRFGYTVDTVRTLVRDFRADRRGFFVAATPGPKSAPAKDAARDRIIELRTTRGLSIDEIGTGWPPRGSG